MYVPPKFAMTPDETASALAAVRFGHLVSHTSDGLVVTPLPLMYDATEHALIGHVARANPHALADGAESVATFAGPHAYVSPGFYATKAETGKVVPTCNYDVLAVYGRLVIHDDADWVLDLVTRLTDLHEDGRTEPWQVSDAPEPFVAGQLKAIVGISLPVTAVEGKAKMSQNQPDRNRDGVVEGLTGTGDVAVAERVREIQRGSTNANGRG